MSTTPKFTVEQFASAIRKKHPGAYDTLSDEDLTRKVLLKYPQYQDALLPSEAENPVQARAAELTPEQAQEQVKASEGAQRREMLPLVGGAVASMLGPEAGIAARAGLAALGGAAGSTAAHAIPTPGQAPLVSVDAAKAIAEDAATQAGLEIGGHLLTKGAGLALSPILNRLRVPVEKAAGKIADMFHPDITPSEFGDMLREVTKQTQNSVGAQKRQVLDQIVQKFPIGAEDIAGKYGLNRRPPSAPGLESFQDATTGGSIEMKQGFTEAELAEKVKAHREAMAATPEAGKSDLAAGKAAKAAETFAKGPHPLILTSTQQALQQALSSLQAEQKLTPSLFAAGEGKARTLAVVQDLQKALSGNQITTLEQLDELRSNLFKLGQGMDRSLPKGVVSQLTHAVHQDIGATLGQFGPEGTAAFRQFENASSAYREVSDSLRTSTMKRIMNSNVNQPEKVFHILMNAPETNMETLGKIIDKSADGPGIRQAIKRMALEQAAASPSLLDSIPEAARAQLFGTDLPRIEKFFSLVSQGKERTGMLQRVVTHGAGVIGGMAAGETVGHPIMGMGVGMSAANWLIKSGEAARTISSSDLAMLLENPKARDLVFKAIQTVPGSKASALILRGLGAYLRPPEPNEVPIAPIPQPIAGGASIGEQLRSKGVQLPIAAPNQPGLPFHPGAGVPR